MNKLIFGTSVALGAALLTSCGGTDSDSSGMTATPTAKALQSRQKAAATAADYYDVVQKLYISYFGRPADPNGLTNFSAQLLALGAPNDAPDLAAAYKTNANIKALIDTFGTSAESMALYGSGDTTSFVTAIFQNVLGRQPASSGLQFWVDGINGGGVTQGDAALAIMAGALTNNTAQGLIDATLIGNRVAVAGNFSAALVSPGQVNAYSGSSAAASARTMLATVDSNTNVSGFQPTVTTEVGTLIALKFQQVQAIVTQRCVPCHSANPTEPGYTSAPLGYEYDTAAEIAQYQQLMYEYAVQTTLMPYGNATGMTTAERTTFGNWFLSGALQNASSVPAPTPTPTPTPAPTPTPTPVLGW